jgi:hypothetical protein
MFVVANYGYFPSLLLVVEANNSEAGESHEGSCGTLINRHGVSPLWFWSVEKAFSSEVTFASET